METRSDWYNVELMAQIHIKLSEDSLKGIKGKFYGSEVFENISKEEVEEYNKKFPQLQKLSFPGQWD